MRAAYHVDSALTAQAQLETLVGEFDRTHPGPASSLREGLEETLTVLRLEVPPTLARTLRSTNRIESIISFSGNPSTSNTASIMPACAGAQAGMIEAGQQFRRVNGHLHLPGFGPHSNGISRPKPSGPHAMITR